MKILPSFLYPAIIVCAFACHSGKADLKAAVDKFADLECRAITLREKRFALADASRFTQDTLLHTTNKADTARLKFKMQSFDKEKERMLKQSLALADSIQTQLAGLMKNELTNQKDKAAFDQMLNNSLKQKGCIKE